MWNHIRNRFTAGGGVGVLIGVGIWLAQGGVTKPDPTPLLYWVGIGFIVIGVGVGIYGLFKTPPQGMESRYFSREDAQGMYEKINNLLTELMKISPSIHQDYEGQPEWYKKYDNDERYKKIIIEINKIRETCADRKFDGWLSAYIRLMIRFARYSDNPYSVKALRLFNQADEHIRNYINTRLRSRE